MKGHKNIKQSLQVLEALGLPCAQRNERSALCLLALLNLSRDKTWDQATNPLIGITPIMDWARVNYRKKYAPNTRETIRRQTMHQFVAAGIAAYNPDDPGRAVNSPMAVYQIESTTLELLRHFGASDWKTRLASYLVEHGTLTKRYARERQFNLVPVQIAGGKSIRLSPGEHSDLIRAIVEEFAPRFAPGSKLIYIGDTGEKWGYFDESSLGRLGIIVDSHGKMPDVVIYCPNRNWLMLVESVTSHGPVDGKRHEELARLFATSSAGLVYVTAFPTRALMARYLVDIAWETEVWVAESPSHLIHFNGERFLGPHNES